MAIWNAAEPLYRTVGFDHGPNPGMPIRLRPDGPRRPGRPGLGCLREEDTDDAVALGLARSGAGVQTGLSLLWRLGSGSVTGLVSAVRVASRTPSCQGSAGRLLARNPSRPARGHQSGQPGPAKQAPRGQPEAEKMIATSNLFRISDSSFSISFPGQKSRGRKAFFHLGGNRSPKIAHGLDREWSTGLVKNYRRGAVSRYVTGWSLGGGSVEPSRRITGPTGVEVLVGGGGGGLGAGVGCGGVG